MYAPGGFNAVIETWSTQGIYAKIKLLDHLTKQFSCIVFDRRECGQSGGRVERITWAHYVAQGKGLLDHLGISRAYLMGGCMGCAPVDGFCCRASRNGLGACALLAGGRRKVPDVEPPAFRRTSGLRAEPWARRRRRTCRQGRQTFRRRPARRPLGFGDQARRRPSPPPTPSKIRSNTSSSAPACAARCSTATPRLAPSPRTSCASTFRR